MVIALSSRKEFLARKRRDYRVYKSFDDDELRDRFDKLPVCPPIYHRLKRLQKTCFLIGARTKKFCFFNDTGTGKSLLAIALVRYFRRLGTIRRTLVLVPNRSNLIEWRDELAKHSPKSSYLILTGSSEEKWQALKETNTLFVFETYAGLYRMVSKLKRNKSGKNKLVLSRSKITHLQKAFEGLVCDESVNVANPKAMPFRVCWQLAKTCEITFTMTGTPFNRDPSLMWAQMFLVDGGYTLGETIGLFRSIFCKETVNYFTGFSDYTFNKKTKGMLTDFIANASIEYEADKASLPAVVEIPKYLELGEAKPYYDKAKEELIAAHGSFRETKNAFIRLRQLSSGFIGYTDDETGERAKLEFMDNPKLDLLLSILRTVKEEHKSIVFFDFTFSGEKILQALKKEKIKATILYGKTRDVEIVKKEFMTNPKTRVLLLQNRMGAGLNVQIAKYGFFYERPVRGIDYKQCRRRVERQHSAHGTVFLYDLIMRGGVDQQIIDFHNEGKDLFEAIIRGTHG